MFRNLLPLTCTLIKPAGPACNLACDYCFYLEKKALFPEQTRMSHETLERVIRQSLEGNPRSFSFIWQGGEPTLMGVDFFRTAVELQKKHGPRTRIGNALQTNGTLLDGQWAEFFRENDFLVGLSLDGDEGAHDTHRRTDDGAGTWQEVRNSARLLLDAGVAVNSVSCITADSATRAADTYHFLRDLGFSHLQFIPVVEKGDDRNLAPFSMTPKGYGRFLCDLFDVWLKDFNGGQPSASIRLFDSIFFTIRGMEAPECGMHQTCGKYLAVEHDGSVYPCDFFVEPAHRLGSVHEHSLGDIFNARKIRTFGGAKAMTPSRCKGCEWLALCGGGCLKDRRNNPRNFRENYFCTSMKMFYSHAVPTLAEMAGRWTRG